MDVYFLWCGQQAHILLRNLSCSTTVPLRFRYPSHTNFAKNDYQSFFHARCLLKLQVLLSSYIIIKSTHPDGCVLFMVRTTGLEPAPSCPDWHLKPARLPIPPCPHILNFYLTQITSASRQLHLISLAPSEGACF